MRRSGGRGAPAEAESGVSRKVPREDFPCRGEFFPDEAEAHQPGAHREFRILALRFLGARAPKFLRRLGKGEAELDVALDFAAVDAAAASFRGVRKLEKAELNGAFREGRVEVQAMVAAFIVMGMPSAVRVVALVPDVLEPTHGSRLFAVQAAEEVPVHRPAVAADAAPVYPHRGNQEAFVARHEVREVADGLRRVSVLADVDVDAAGVRGVAFRPGAAELPQELLELRDVLVAEDGRHELRLLAAVGVDADVPLEFLFASLPVPGAPGVVAITGGSVLEAPGAEESSGNPRRFHPADAVHLDLHSDGLLLHFLDAPCRCCVHFAFSFRSAVCSFR